MQLQMKSRIQHTRVSVAASDLRRTAPGKLKTIIRQPYC
jgi:hypothetical protein